MKRAKSIMSMLLLNNADSTWDTDRERLASTIESWFPREKMKDNPTRYTSVEEQRALRLQVIGKLLGRDEGSPLTSFKPQTSEEPNNMGLVEARALQTFISRMGFDVHGEVKAEYQAQSRALLDDKEARLKAEESERLRLEALGQVDGFGDVQLYLPDLSKASAG